MPKHLKGLVSNIVRFSHEMKMENSKNVPNGISHEKYDIWMFYNAILEDNVNTVVDYLNTALLPKEKHINNIKFDFSENFGKEFSNFEGDVNTLVSLPLHVAVVNGSRCVIRHLLSRDVDVFACDNNNNNILHSLIAVAHTHKNQRELKAAKTYDR